jgi:Uma2 family endonuclease
VKIAVISLRNDKARKAPLYARQGIRELWVVDANQRKAWIYTGPTADGWSSTVEVGPQDPLTTQAIPGLVIKLGDRE